MADDPNRRYRESPDAAHWSKHFRRPERGVWEQRERLLSEMRLRPGMVVMDIGAGPGTFTRPLLEGVGEQGVVHAVEVADPFVACLDELAREHSNLRVHRVVDQADPRSVDLAICIDTYHHLEHPQAVMGALARVLAPEGRLLLVDLRLDEHSSPELREHVRADPATVERELDQVGLCVVERRPDLADNYVLWLRRRCS